METTLKILNTMTKKGIITDYAIGGATALLFYTEPATTYDLDVFVFLPDADKSSLMVNLNSIYEYCKKQKYTIKQEHIIIESVAVQFIPAYNGLVENAVLEAKTELYGKTRVRVLTLEYLMAIMLQTGRPKDSARLAQIVGEAQFDKTLLEKILKTHGLTNGWKNFCKKNAL